MNIFIYCNCEEFSISGDHVISFMYGSGSNIEIFSALYQCLRLIKALAFPTAANAILHHVLL